MPTYTLQWQGSPFNAASITQLYIVDKLGSAYSFLDCLNGDIALVQPKIGQYDAFSRALVQGTLQAQVEIGSITIPLLARWLAANGGAGTPSLLDVLSQTTEGLSYQPYTAIALPAWGSLPARTMYADSFVKTWKFVIVVNTASLDGAPRETYITCYASVPTPDLTVANVGGQATIQIVGSIKDPAALTVEAQ